MRNLRIWLDDTRLAPAGWIWITNAHALCLLLDNQMVWDCIEMMSLDHDLGNDDLYGTGYTVVCHIERLVKADGRTLDFPVRLHSANPVGIRKMRNVIENLK